MGLLFHRVLRRSLLSLVMNVDGGTSKVQMCQRQDKSFMLMRSVRPWRDTLRDVMFFAMIESF